MDRPTNTIRKCLFLAAGYDTRFLPATKAMPKEEAPTNQAVTGRYILTPDIFEMIENTKLGKGGEVQITDALCAEAKKGMVIAYKFKGKRFDCGSVDGFVEATNYFYNLEKGKA